MIFLVLGSQKFQMNRLLQKVDSLKEKGIITDPVVVQKGYSDYEPKHLISHDFLEKSVFEDYLEQADLILCHGGTGVIVTSLKKGKKVIAVPRDRRYGEHVDQHQFQIVKLFSKLGFIEGVLDVEELETALKNYQTQTYHPFVSTNQEFMQSLRKDLEDLISDN